MTDNPTGAPQPVMSFPVSWEELHRNSRALAWRLVEQKRWQGIIAITRGGLVPAGIIARELEIRVIDTVGVASYEHQTQGEAQVIKRPCGAAGDSDGTDWLLIDDLVDTGQTAAVVRELLPGAHLATIYAKPNGRPQVDTFITEVSQDTWIYFPWDVGLQFVEPIAARKSPG